MTGSDDSTRDREARLLERIARWPKFDSLAELSAERLRRITVEEGIDFATALLHDRVRRSPRHGPFCRRVDELREDGSVPRRRLDGVRFIVVPGAFHHTYPRIDADGGMLRQVAAELGCEAEWIPLPETGGLERNARMVIDFLHARRDRPVILASLSKGGADVKLALSAADAARAFDPVVAWINVCGMLDGTPLVEKLLANRWRTALVRSSFWWRGFDFRLVEDLHAGRGRLLDRPLRLQAHVRLVHVVGFPLRDHLSNRRSRKWHRALSPLGPNDGGVLLHDVCRLPGRMYPVWGTDHYLASRATDMRSLTLGLLRLLSEELGSPAPEPEFEPLCAATSEPST